MLMATASDEGSTFALRWRSRAVRSIERGLPAIALLALRKSSRSVGPHQPVPGSIDRANRDYLHDTLRLEIMLLDGIRRGRIGEAANAFNILVRLHETRAQAARALQDLPQDVRVFGGPLSSESASPLVFALPFSILRTYLLAATPPLFECAHGRLNAGGSCTLEAYS